MKRRAFMSRMAAGVFAASMLRDSVFRGLPELAEPEIVGWEWQVVEAESYPAGVGYFVDSGYIPVPRGRGPTYESHRVPVYSDGTRGEPIP